MRRTFDDADRQFEFFDVLPRYAVAGIFVSASTSASTMV